MSVKFKPAKVSIPAVVLIEGTKELAKFGEKKFKDATVAVKLKKSIRKILEESKDIEDLRVEKIKELGIEVDNGTTIPDYVTVDENGKQAVAEKDDEGAISNPNKVEFMDFMEDLMEGEHEVSVYTIDELEFAEALSEEVSVSDLEILEIFKITTSEDEEEVEVVESTEE